jgi:hypothetical protein
MAETIRIISPPEAQTIEYRGKMRDSPKEIPRFSCAVIAPCGSPNP